MKNDTFSVSGNTCNPDVFLQWLDEIKRENRRPYHNIFLNSNEIREQAKRSDARMARIGKSAFLLLPKHQSWLDILFLTANVSSFENDLKVLLETLDVPARLSLIGKEDYVDEFAVAAQNAGFDYGRKLTRISLYNNQKMNDCLARLENTTSKWEAEFARPGDEQQLLDLMLTEFDSRAFGVPDLEEIKKNVEQNQVIVVRDKEKIVSLLYFTQKNGMIFDLFDVTDEAYRQEGVQWKKNQFLNSQRKQEANRFLRWRNTADKRMMKFSKTIGEIPDGIFIVNLLYK